MDTIKSADELTLHATDRTSAATLRISAPNIIREDESNAAQSTETFDILYIRRPRLWLGVILVAFVVAASSYAFFTPAWQSPDEPAHYNYIGFIAEVHALPILKIGDYDQLLLQTLVSSRFQSSELVSLLRYEYHQPPLYYLAATPLFWVSGGNLYLLRLFGVLIGACTILLGFVDRLPGSSPACGGRRGCRG